MIAYGRRVIFWGVFAALLIVFVGSAYTADVPSGAVGVFPNKEPTGETDLGSHGHGTVDNNNSNLTMDFGFYLPTPTPTPVAGPKPGPVTDADLDDNRETETDGSRLGLTKSVNRGSVTPGQVVEYTVTVTNSEALPVRNVTLQDRLPDGFSYSPGSASIDGSSVADPSVSGRLLNFSIDMIPARSFVTIRYSAVASSDIAAGSYDNVAFLDNGEEASATVHVEAGRRSGSEHFGKFREGVDIYPPCVIIPAEIEEPWFITDIAMYAASELHETSHPFIQWSEENGLALDQHLFSPTGVREFGVEMLEFSVNNVNTVLTNSGIGLHFKYAPFLVAGAKAKGISPETYLQERLREYARRSNLKVVPQNIYPIFVEYAEGDPRYMQSVNINDWETLLWDRQRFNTHLIPSAYGQALLRQVLLLGDFLASQHDKSGRPHSDGAFLGIDDARGFVGILTAESVVNKLWFMANTLLQSGDDSVIPYFPYQTVVTPNSLEKGHPEPQVVDARTRLFDQLSLLWALSELMLLTGDESPESYRQAFSQELLAPDVNFRTIEQSFPVSVDRLSADSVHALTGKLAEIVFETIVTLHYDDEAEVLVDSVLPGGQRGTHENGEETAQAKVVTTYLGLMITAMEHYYEATSRYPERRRDILDMVRVAADYLLEHLADRKNGGFWSEQVLEPENSDQGEPRKSGKRQKSLSSQMAAIRGLLSAYALTQDARYRSLAYDTYTYLEKTFWKADFGIYKDRATRGLYTYTPMDIGLVTGALRELIYQADDARQILDMTRRMKTFVKQIAKYAGLQLSEVITESTQAFLRPVGEANSIRTAVSLDSPFGLAPVLGSEVTLNHDAILALLAGLPTDACEQTRSSFRSAYYYTDIGMYAASEFGLARSALQGDRTTAISGTPERNRNPELLHLTATERIAQKASDFSDYNLVHIHTKSALGIGLKYGPLVQREAVAKGISPEVHLEEVMQEYATLTGLDRFPSHLLPIFLEFEGGIPEIEYGGESERWLDENMDTSLLPSAFGQSLRRQVLWLKSVLADRHDERNRVAADGAYLGRNAEEGFLGLLVAQEIANKIVFLRETLLTPLDSESVTTPSGLYIPHRIEADFDGDEPIEYVVEDTASSLFDQVSLLWGMSELYALLTAEQDKPYAGIFGTDKLIDLDLAERTKELITIVLENLKALHWNPAYQTFYDWHSFSEVQDEPVQSQRISTHLAAMAMIALESVLQHVSDAPALQHNAQTLLLGQTLFFQKHLFRESDGAVYNGARLGATVEPFGGLKTLLAHASAIRSFLIAYRMTGEPFYLQRARHVFEALDRSFWDSQLNIYKSSYNQYHYTPLSVGMTVGAFREFLALDSTEFLARMNEHFSSFFKQVVERIGLQLSEQQHFMELVGEPETLAPVFAASLMVQPAGSDVAGNIPQPGSTLIYVIKGLASELACATEDAYIEDTLPEGVTFIRSMPAPDSIKHGVLRWNVADLSVDEKGFYTVQLEVQVNPFSSSGFGLSYEDIQIGNRTWSMKNCASLWCGDPEKGQELLETDCVDDKLETPQLGVEKSLLTLGAEPGGDAEFEIVVTNLSEVTAYSVTIEDSNPSGFLYLKDSVRSQGVVKVDLLDTQPLVWGLENLEPGQSFRLTYRVRLDSRLKEGIYQTAVNVHAMDLSGFQFSSNEFTLNVALEKTVALKIAQQVLEPQDAAGIQAGLPFSVEIRLENIGSEDLIDGRIEVVLPDGVDYIVNSGRINDVAIENPQREKQKLLWKVGEIAQGVTKKLHYDLRSGRELSDNLTFTTVVHGISASGTPFTSKERKLTLSFIP